ncbi:NAD(P)-binding protein [Saccharata proteae CBS 121410]|uniref:NAD(P)-binding protein n=1 Tax=Saccharata proteae CBS 121410 TaxID=1314787 RepID=A0A9P4HT01_9PEZI|nr:NAD(P)-binding protein [Saccharata proteae CBS 121410]
MRVAIAGTGGLAQLIAHYIRAETSHQFLMISRTTHSELDALDYQVQTVDYNDPSTLQYALAGVDVVISTVVGTPQLQLIKAAISAGVRRFAPAEFEGPPSVRPSGDALDRDRATALSYLQHYAAFFEATTVFVCGVLYERFQQGGLAASAMGSGTGVGAEGSYVLDLRYMRAQVPAYDSANRLSMVCLTAAQDVARFVVRALDLPVWPPELRMCGERMRVADLVVVAREVRGKSGGSYFFPAPVFESSSTLSYQLSLASDVQEQMRLRQLIATADGQYDFREPNLNCYFPQIRPLGFKEWLRSNWAGVP